MKLAALLLLACAALIAQTASVEGTVINQATGQPLAGVHLRIFSLTFNGPGDKLFGATTDQNGRFAITCITPGSYIVLPELTRYVPAQQKGGLVPLRNLSIKSGDIVKDYEVGMLPRSVIRGRVLDQNGDPVSRVNIRLEPAEKGGPSFLGVLDDQFNQSDERGEFRFAGHPGSYYVKASLHGDAGDFESYYPGTPARDRATPVQLDPGQDAGGVDIRIARDSEELLTISGTVTGSREQDGRAMVALQWGNSATTRSVEPNGQFTIMNLKRGSYRIYAYYGGGRSLLVSPAQDLNLDTDVSGVTLALGPGMEATGSVVMTNEAGSAVAVPTAKVALALRGMSTAWRPSGDVGKDGAFRIAGLMPQTYQVKVEPMPEGAYVKEITVDGARVDGGMIDLGKHAKARIQITLAHGSGEVSGVVRDASGSALNGRLLMVFLVGDSKQIQSGDSLRLKDDAKYEFSARAPGKYRLFAVEPLTANVKSDEDLKELAKTVEAFELKPGDKVTKDLIPLVKGAADATRK